MSIGIVIDWDDVKEFIQLDVVGLLAGGEITTTTELWKREKRTARYNTRSTVHQLSEDEIEVTLYYDHSLNTHIQWDDVCWGKSVLLIKKEASEGTASWYDDNDKSYNGTTTWTKLPSGLFKEKKREYYSRLKREQNAFRAALLAFDECCVISKETTTEALEAAHIIPSKLCGAEVVENGIILRSDIHRLYDSGYFNINPSGEIVVIREVTDYYRSILDGVRLPKHTVQRISGALEHQWQEAAQQVVAADHHPSTRDGGS